MILEEGKAVCSKHDVISLVADSTCDELQRDVPITYFHPDLAAQNEPPPMNPQVLFELEDIPREITLGIGEREKSH